MTIQLSDTQLVILSAACARDDRAVFPITAKLKGGAVGNVCKSLLKRNLIEEVPASDLNTVYRHDEHQGPVTLRATAAACEALGIDAEGEDPPPSGGAGAGVSAAEPERASLGAAETGKKSDVAPARGGGAENVGQGRTKASKATTGPDRADTGKVRSGTKQALLIDMLRRKDGATINEILAATGWLPHTARGAMSGALKKRLGFAINSEKVEGRGRVYRIVG